MQVGGRLQNLKLGLNWVSNPLGPIKVSIQSETGSDLTGFIGLIQGSESCPSFQGPRTLPVDSLDLTHEPHPRFLMQGHILRLGGDALMALYTKGSGFFNPSLF